VSRPPTVVFLHAHPDDEAIFTGGTMRLLADGGVRVVLVVATGGELGEAPADEAHRLAEVRAGETRAAADLLGVDEVAFLGFADSGLGPGAPPGSFAAAPVGLGVARLAEVLARLGADVLVSYDEHGIYGHPDHVRVHEVATGAAAAAGVATRYEATVDREYLHFVETHLVEEAGRALTVPVGPLDGTDAPFAPSLHGPTAAPPGAGPPGPGHAAGRPAAAGPGLGLAATVVGLPSVLVDRTVDVRPVIATKRAAMLAHASQIPASSSAMRLSPAAFAEVYGFEWYARHGPPGPLDDLPGR
jgi:LmbE family N-acetylglucosaminyl deacetylase